MENNKIIGKDLKGNIVCGFKDIITMSNELNLEIVEVLKFIKDHVDFKGIKYYTNDKFEKEFLEFYDLFFDKEENISATKEYVDQDFDWSKLNDPKYLEKQLKTKVHFDNRNKIITDKISNKDELGGTDGGKYSSNGSSEHYKKAVLEYIDKQERCYGTFMAYGLCFMQVDKYRDRAGKKEGVPIEKDMVKANWYDACASFLLEKIELNNKILVDDSNKEELCIKFDKEYGNGRHIYINMPGVLINLSSFEFNTKLSLPLKSLGEIVDNKLK